MPTPADTLEIAEVCLYLSSNEIAQKNALRGGALVSKTNIIIFIVYRAMKTVYDKDNSYTGLQAVANFLYWLCGKLALQAEGILALNGGGGTVNPTTGSAAAIRFFDDELLVATGGTLEPGDTSYTLPYDYIIEDSVSVELPQSNVPEGQTNQFSYSISYRTSGTIISFTNDDGAGNNLGVIDGMLIMIRGARYVSASASGGSTSSTPSITIFFGNEVVASVYTNTDFAGWNATLFANGIAKYLIRDVDFTISAGGVFTFIGAYAGVTFTSDDAFILTPNGAL